MNATTISRAAAALRKGATIKSIRAELKAHGLKQTAPFISAMQAEIERQEAVRAKRAAMSAYAAFKGRDTCLPCLDGSAPQQRLDDIRRAAVVALYQRTYRCAVNGTESAVLTRTPAHVGVRQVEGLDWDLYRGTHKGYPARVQDTEVCVPHTWRVRVERKGLAVIDGMMTLDASPMDADGCELFAAVWGVQQRGTGVAAVRGYIARISDVAYHADTAEAAVAGVVRKARRVERDRTINARIDARDFSALAAEHGNARVTVGDARAVGACEYGIKGWCSAVGIDYDAGETTLARMLEAYQQRPYAEARATIIRVLRRQRAA